MASSVQIAELERLTEEVNKWQIRNAELIGLNVTLEQGNEFLRGSVRSKIAKIEEFSATISNLRIRIASLERERAELREVNAELIRKSLPDAL